MVNRRRFLEGAALAGAASGLAVASSFPKPAIAQGLKRFRMQMTWPRNFPGLGTGANFLAETIRRMSDGTIEIEIFGAGEIVPAFETIDAVESGTLDMGHSAPYYWKGKVPATEFIAGVPFGLTAWEATSWMQFGGGQELADEAYAQMNCKFFLSGCTGTQMAGWYSKEMNSIDDYRGLRMRLPGLGGEVIAAAGAAVINLPAGEIGPAMASGTLDAADWISPYNDLAIGMHRSGWYYYYPGWQEPGPIMDNFINLVVWNSLTDSEKAMFEAANAAANAHVYSEFLANNNAALAEMVNEHNVQLRRLTDETLIHLAELSRDVLDDLANADPLSRRVYDSILKFRAQALHWGNIAESAIMQARALDYQFSQPSEG